MRDNHTLRIPEKAQNLPVILQKINHRLVQAGQPAELLIPSPPVPEKSSGIPFL